MTTSSTSTTCFIRRSLSLEVAALTRFREAPAFMHGERRKVALQGQQLFPLAWGIIIEIFSCHALRHSLKRASVWAWCHAAIVIVIHQRHPFFSSRRLVRRGRAVCQAAYGCGCLFVKRCGAWLAACQRQAPSFNYGVLDCLHEVRPRLSRSLPSTTPGTGASPTSLPFSTSRIG